MTLITKEDKDSYNSVVNDINQKISGLINKIEAIVNESENNSDTLNSQLEALISKADKLKTYVNGLLVINKQMDSAMPSECDYSWVYTEKEYSCDDSDSCGELS